MSQPITPLLELRSVSRTFLTDEMQTNALHEIDLSISKGDFVSISGPSGCGKSTLMSILGTLDVPSSGQYLFESSDLAALNEADRAFIRSRKIGFVFQSFNLIGDLTVLENVMVPLIYRDDVLKKDRIDMAMTALSRVDMSHRSGHYPSQLSGGQQQRVAVARALVGNPQILLADEPTGNLDSSNSEAVMQLLLDLHSGGSTICMVTHDPRHAQLASRMVKMLDGRITQSS